MYLDSDTAERLTESKVSDRGVGEPTYDSHGVEYWIDSRSSDKRRRSATLKIIQQLAPHLSEDRKKEIVERRLDLYKHEVSPSFHTAMAASLAPLCYSEELFNKLFDHVSSRTDPKFLEFSSPERFQAKMLQELKSEDPEKQSKSIQWAEQYIVRRSEEELLKQQLIPEWKDALLKRIDNVDQQQ